jgi:predicted transcriptional regulator
MADAREKFATQVDPEVLGNIRQLAQAEGRQLQALVEEALKDLIEKRKNTSPRAKVMAAYQASHERYATLYQKLAK